MLQKISFCVLAVMIITVSFAQDTTQQIISGRTNSSKDPNVLFRTNQGTSCA